MAWGVLPMMLGFCLLFFSYGEGNESHTELQRAKVVPVSMTGPGAVQQEEAAVFELELKRHNPDIMLMICKQTLLYVKTTWNYRPRLRRRAEKKKKKHNAGSFSPISMSQDGKKAHNSRTKRQGNSKGKKTKFVKQLLKYEQS